MLAKDVVIIDDEADLANLFTEALEMNGYTVCTFTDSIKALNHIQQQIPEKYALVISDYKMPRMDGNELCTKLMDFNPKLKVILISAYTDIEYDTSRFAFLQKPITVAHLLKIVKENLTD